MNHPSPKSQSSSDSTLERYAYNAETLGVECKSLDFIWQKRELTERAHRAAFYQLLWVTTGKLVMHLDFQRVEVSAGEACFVGVGQVCRYDVEESFPQGDATEDMPHPPATVGQCVLFSPEFLGEVGVDTTMLRQLAPPLSAPKVFAPNDAQQFSALLHNIHNELQQPAHPLQRIVVQSFLRVALATLATAEDTSTASNEATHLAQRFIDTVEEHLCEWPNVADYHAHLCVGEKPLAQAVRAVTGYTPKAYLDQRRILQAQRLLIYSHQTAKEIAYALGFDEPTNFHKFFRKHVGETPQDFRAKYAEK